MNPVKVMKNTLEINGMSLYYECHGEGQPLLLLHGFTGSGQAMAEIFKSFSDHYQLIIPDLRDHGHSTNNLTSFTHKQAALDILALLDHLAIKQCSALGFSGGANALLHLTKQQSDRIKKMVLISATPYFPEQARTIMRQFTLESHTDDEWQQMRSIHHHGDEQIKALWLQAQEFADSQDDMNFTYKDLQTINSKTLVIHGDRDPLYPVQIGIELYKGLANSELWIVPNGGHVPLTKFFLPMIIDYSEVFFRE